MPPTSECNIKENQGQDANYCGDNGILLLHKERSHVQNDLKSLTVQNKLFEKRGESDEFLSFSLSLSLSLCLSLSLSLVLEADQIFTAIYMVPDPHCAVAQNEHCLRPNINGAVAPCSFSKI